MTDPIDMHDNQPADALDASQGAMTVVYQIDALGIYAGTVEVGEFAPVPLGVDMAPPALVGAEVARWIGSGWEVLAAYPSQASPTLPPAVPVAVTMRQARLALLGAGMLSQVNAAIAGMQGVAGEAARIEWEFSSDVKRGQPLVMALGPALGMSEAQLDALFTAAAAL